MRNVGVFKITSDKNVDYLGVGIYFESIVTEEDSEYAEFADGELTVPMTILRGESINLMDYTWVSDDAVAETINQFNNQTLLENKEIHYKMMLTLFPKMSYAPRINYIKKAQEEIQEEDKRIKLLAAKYELSQKEIISLIASSPTSLKESNPVNN